MRFSVIIPTHCRSAHLARTLESISGLVVDGEWEVIVVDNNSQDHTEDVVRRAGSTFPVPVRYVWEGVRGRSAALNAGITASRGEILAVTDDDVRVEKDWLDVAEASLRRHGCDYLAGRVLPIWETSPPPWLPMRGGKHWAAIALLDYGPTAGPLGDRAPLGVNMVFRRDAFERAGLWNNELGRRAGTLLGQEVREWGLRARAAGLSAYYEPRMVVHHEIPTSRLTKAYFRRWFYWHGVSRAILYNMAAVDMEAPEASTLNFANVSHVLRVPRYMFRSCAGKVGRALSHRLRGNVVEAFEHELWCWFFAGILARQWRFASGASETRPAPRATHE